MTQYDNTNSGLLAKNDRREKETQPEYRGKINIEGVEYWLSAWVKVGREGTKLAGQKYFSLSATPIEEPRHAPAPPQRPPAAPQRSRPRPVEELADDIPF